MLRCRMKTFAMQCLTWLHTKVLHTMRLPAKHFTVIAAIQYISVIQSTPVFACKQTAPKFNLFCLFHQAQMFNLSSPVVTLYTSRFNSKQLHVLPTQCIYVFSIDLRTNSDYFPRRH
jgi:hypothetical protein